MQNEKLFDRIRQTALTETAGTDDFDPEKVWSHIQRQDKRIVTLSWWPYAAASLALLLVIGCYWADKQQNVEASASEVRPLSSAEKATERIVVGTCKPAKSPELPTVKATIRRGNKSGQRAATGVQIAVNLDSMVRESASDQTEIVKNSVALFADSTDPQPDNFPATNHRTEKVLVASIALPEQKVEQTYGLKRMYDQIKKDREARKLRVQINRQVGKSTLWSFVHQSFVEIPPVQSKPHN